MWTGSEMIVWGGVGTGGVQNTGGRYNPVANTWATTETVGAPFARADHTAIWTGSEMIVWGGSRFVAPSYVHLGTGGVYDPVGNVWTPTTTVNAPSPRTRYTAVWTGEGMVVWSGGDLNTNETSRNGGIYFPGDLGAGADADGDAFCSLDCDDTLATVYPGAPQVCDGVNNDCSAPGWPSLAQTNEADNDGDGLSTCQQDCNDADGTAYGTPGEVPLLLADQVAQQTIFTWTAPGELGGTSAGYDTLRTSFAGDFVQDATCVESADGSDTTSSDPQDPPLGSVYCYLVQVENACPHPIGLGVLGTSSEGVPRYGRTCP